jgi:hypothetical protein
VTAPVSASFDDPEYDALLDEVERTAPNVAEGEMGVDPTADAQKANTTVAPNAPEDALDIQLPKDVQLRALARALYGDDFPLAGDFDAESSPLVDSAAWVSWVRGRWTERRLSVEQHIHLVERNRLFRAGQQWVTATGLGPWREPVRPSESSRIVCNLVRPALDARLQIVTEQRPGFSVSPMTLDPDDQRKAEARQAALEFQFEAQNMSGIRREACYWAQTDGVSFLHTTWDDQAGPWDERMGENGSKKPLGDLRTVVNRVEQVRVSPNASANEKPYYAIVREVISANEAAQRYGVTGALASGTNGDVAIATGSDALGDNSSMSDWVMQLSNPGTADRLRNADVVERFTMYVDRHPDLLPEGLQIVVVGEAVTIGPMPLLFGTIPVVRVPDGTTDPSYFPRPVMEDWIPEQQRINALKSKWVDAVRVNSGGRLLARPGAVTKETFLGGLTSVVEVTGASANLSDAVVPFPSFSVASDLKELLAAEIKVFEDKSGYNDATRGNFSSGESGRAIIAQREQLERVFAPSVYAVAEALTQWGKVQLAGMAWGYDVPRDLGAVGKGRPDLARALKSSDFDGSADVKVEPETLMPMPKAMRLFLLDEMFAKRDANGQALLTAQDYRRLMPFALMKQLQSPDSDQEARANRVCDALLVRGVVPVMRWQDNEAIHQDVLERKIILQDDIEEDIIAAAQARWVELANQSMMKQGGGMPQPPASPAGPPAGGAPAASGGPSPFAPSPASQPLASSLPAIAAQPSGVAQDVALFESAAPQ